MQNQTQVISSIDDLNVMGDKILIEAIVEKEADGVIRGKTADNKPQQGLVLAVGPDVEGDLEKGNIVLFNKYSTTKFVLDGVDYHVLRTEDVVGYK